MMLSVSPLHRPGLGENPVDRSRCDDGWDCQVQSRDHHVKQGRSGYGDRYDGAETRNCTAGN